MKKFFIVFLIISLALLLGSCSIAKDETSNNYEDSKGFSLNCPVGWEVTSDASGLITVSKSPSSDKSFAFFRGMFVNTGVTADQALVESIVPLENYLGITISTDNKRSYNEGNSIIADFNYEENNIEYCGLINFSIEGLNTFLSGMVAPTSLQNQEGPTLLSILESFEYRTDLMNQPLGLSPVAVDYDWTKKNLVTFVDPNEGAFTVSVPEGWRIKGGTFRYYIDASFLLSMEGENDTAILISEPNPPFYVQFQDWQKSMSGDLLKDGANIYNIDNSVGGLGMIIKDYMDAETYQKEIIFSQLKQQYPNESVKLDSIADSSSEFETVMTSPIISEWSASRAVFSDNKNRLHVYNVITRRMDTAGGAYIWQVDLQYFRAPKAQITSFEKMFNTIFYSLKLTPEWKETEKNEQIKRDRILSTNQQEIDDIINQTYQNRSDSQDQTARNFSNVILGTTDMIDPDTGQIFSVPNDSNYYWSQGSVVIETQTQDNPLPLENFRELEAWLK